MLNVQFLNHYKVNTPETKSYNQSAPSFQGAADKLAKKLINTPVGHTCKLTVDFEDATRLYKEMGFDIILKQGSHATAKRANAPSVTIVMPHGNKKGLCAGDVVDLKKAVLKYYTK